MRSGPVLFSLLSTPPPTDIAFTGGRGTLSTVKPHLALALCISLGHTNQLADPQGPGILWGGPKVHQDGQALLMSRCKVGNSLHPRCIYASHVPLSGRTQSAFRPAVRSWSRSCCLRSRSWSSLPRSRSGYAVSSDAQPSLHPFFWLWPTFPDIHLRTSLFFKLKEPFSCTREHLKSEMIPR